MSLFGYYGGKANLADRILRYMPPHRVYIEPFFGSGAVFWAKGPSEHEVINDLDGRLVAFFRCLRDQPTELARVCEMTPYSREEYDTVHFETPAEREELSDLERARRFWVAITQGFSGLQHKGWSSSASGTCAAKSVQSKIKRFEAYAKRMAQAKIECRDAANVIERFARTPDAVVYADPPYLDMTRVTGAKDYDVESADEEFHRRLAKTLNDTPAAVVLSGYPSELYEELYDGWWIQDFEVPTTAGNAAVTGGRATRTERIWMNRPPVKKLWTPHLDQAAGGLIEDEL